MYAWQLGPYPELAIRNALWLANEDFKFRKKAQEALLADKMAQKAIDDLSNMYTDWDLGCAAIILLKEYDFTPKQVSEFLTKIQDMTVEFAKEELDADEIWEKASDLGLDIERVY